MPLQGHNLSLQVAALGLQLLELTPQGHLLRLQRGILGEKNKYTYSKKSSIHTGESHKSSFFADVLLTHVPLHFDESVFDLQQLPGGFVALLLPSNDALRVLSSCRGRALHHPLLLLPLAQGLVVFLHLERRRVGVKTLDAPSSNDTLHRALTGRTRRCPRFDWKKLWILNKNTSQKQIRHPLLLFHRLLPPH